MNWQNILSAGIAGLIAAASTDFEAFKDWQNLDQALTFAWSKALFRWVKGFVLGAVSAMAVGL